MMSISMQTFHKLCNDSIELIKAQNEIANLNKSIEKLNAEIGKWNAKFSHLSAVSVDIHRAVINNSLVM